jgi:hypothetical protein
MTDWDSDPELKTLRDEFVQSFGKRAEALKKLLPVFRSAGNAPLSADNGAALEAKVIAHNLAGAAPTYGFDSIGRRAAELDDFLSLGQSLPATKILQLSEALLGELTSSSGSPASAARP